MAGPLDSKPTKPILLPLSRENLEPQTIDDLRSQALNHYVDRRLKTPPVAFGTQGVYRVAINATVTLQPDLLRLPIKIPGRISVSMQPPAADRAAGGARPRVIFARFN